MGNWYDDEDDEFEGQSNSDGKGLRAQLKAALAENKSLKEENGKFRTQVAQTTLKDVLQEKGFNPALGKFILKDGVDAGDKAAVDAWLEENGPLFGGAKSTSEEQSPQDEGAAEFARMQNAQANALPTGKYSDAAKHLDEALKGGSVQDVNAVLREAAKH